MLRNAPAYCVFSLQRKFFCLNVLIQGIFRYGPESLELFCRNLLKWCHDIQNNIIQYNDTKNRVIFSTIRINDIQQR